MADVEPADFRTLASNTATTDVLVEMTLDTNPWAEATSTDGAAQEGLAHADFRTLTSNTTPTNVLVEATLDSLAITNPWLEVTSTNGAAQEVLQSLYEESERFASSVTQSWRSAQAGRSFAERAIKLCNRLLEEEIDDKEIQALLTEMREITQKAHEESTTTAGQFRLNRQGFHRVVASVPKMEKSMDSDHQREQMGKDKAERKAENWANMLERLSPFVRKSKKKSKKTRSDKSWAKGKSQDRDEEADSSNNTGDEGAKEKKSGALNVAGALLSLPVTLPMVAVAKTKRSLLKAQAEGADRKIVAIKAERKKVDDVTEKLGDLSEKVNRVADYWLAMDSMLEDMQIRVIGLQNDFALRIEVKSLLEDWRLIGREYSQYKTQLVTLEGSSPQIRAITDGNREHSVAHAQPSTSHRKARAAKK